MTEIGVIKGAIIGYDQLGDVRSIKRKKAQEALWSLGHFLQPARTELTRSDIRLQKYFQQEVACNRPVLNTAPRSREGDNIHQSTQKQMTHKPVALKIRFSAQGAGG
jgi:hypothetical protein